MVTFVCCCVIFTISCLSARRLKNANRSVCEWMMRYLEMTKSSDRWQVRYNKAISQAIAMRRLVQRNNERLRLLQPELQAALAEKNRLQERVLFLETSLQSLHDWSNAQQRKATS